MGRWVLPETVSPAVEHAREELAWMRANGAREDSIPICMVKGLARLRKREKGYAQSTDACLIEMHLLNLWRRRRYWESHEAEERHWSGDKRHTSTGMVSS